MNRSHFQVGFRLVLILVTATVFCTDRVKADTVILKNKSKFEGRVVLSNDKKVVIETGYGTITFKRSTVQKVTKEAWTLPLKKSDAIPWKPSPYRKYSPPKKYGKSKKAKRIVSRSRGKSSRYPVKSTRTCPPKKKKPLFPPKTKRRSGGGRPRRR